MATIISKGLCLGFLLISLASPPVAANEFVRLSEDIVPLASHEGEQTVPAAQTQISKTDHPRRASFFDTKASQGARQVGDWVVDSDDNGNLPFVIVDKADAKVFVFGSDGRLRGAAPALVGLAVGDDSVPGIGDRALTSIRPDERTTPAGRFVASLGHDMGKLNVLWVNYDEAVSLHRVITSNPKERRLQRLADPSPLEHRISYGCINVPAKFFDSVVQPAFKGTSGIVYILPEVKSMREIFPTYYDVKEHSQRRTVSPPAPKPR
jgi:hypothetical protein